MTLRSARQLAREEITREILTIARGRLAAEGPSALSLRAIAREMGTVSSAIYRYFASRDELLTALIVQAYDALGDAVEAAVAETQHSPAERFTVIWRMARGWALANPHEYALIYGSPVPGYEAPQTTIAPASRVGVLVIDALREGATVLGPSDAGELPAAVTDAVAPLAGSDGSGVRPGVLVHAVQAWAELFGMISFEVFGQFNNVVADTETFFEHAVATWRRRLFGPTGG